MFDWLLLKHGNCACLSDLSIVFLSYKISFNYWGKVYPIVCKKKISQLVKIKL